MSIEYVLLFFVWGFITYLLGTIVGLYNERSKEKESVSDANVVDYLEGKPTKDELKEAKRQKKSVV